MSLRILVRGGGVLEAVLTCANLHAYMGEGEE